MREPTMAELMALKSLCRKAYLLHAEIENLLRDEKFAGGYALAAADEEYRRTIVAIEAEGIK